MENELPPTEKKRLKLVIGTGLTPAHMPGDEAPTTKVPCPQCGWIRRFTDAEIEAFKDKPEKKLCMRCLNPIKCVKKKKGMVRMATDRNPFHDPCPPEVSVIGVIGPRVDDRKDHL